MKFVFSATIAQVLFVRGSYSDDNTRRLQFEPENDVCTNATAMNVGGSVNGSTVEATLGEDQIECFATPQDDDIFTSTAHRDVWYSVAGNGDIFTATTCDPDNTDFNTQIAIYTGTACDSLSCIDGNDNADPTECSTVTWTTTAGTTYKIRVFGALGDAGDFMLTVTSSPSSGGGGGDPHFKTWSGLKYDFHGECDLVLVVNHLFARGLGLRLHIRTIRRGFFSYIERAALQIGSDVLEFASRDEWYVNGEKRKAHAKMAGYDVWKFRNTVSVRLGDKTGSKASIDFISRNNGMPYVNVNGGSTDMFRGSLGMIGDWKHGKMIARDGMAEMNDPDLFAREWQVRDTEPNLFRSSRAPQYPAACNAPKKGLGKRLGDSHMKAQAEKQCASWGEDKDDCIFDVMATRDINAAEDLDDSTKKWIPNVSTN